MSISNNLEEISACIVCPQCKHNSPKYWMVSRLETNGKPKVRKSKVYFRCIVCDYLTEVFDKRLVKFIDSELMNNDDYDDDRLSR
ncbi:MAG: hypothetical protein ABJB76_12070 [Candidatus Nitrosocosmicus sp.]